MGKKISSWTPPADDPVVETPPQKTTSAWQPPDTDQVVEVKKKDVGAPGGSESPQPTEQQPKNIGNYTSSGNPNDPFGIGEVVAKAVYSGFAHQIPAAVSIFPALNTQSYEKNLLAKEPASKKSAIAGKLFRQNLMNFELGKAFTVGDKEIEEEFIKDLKGRIGEEQYNKDKAVYEKTLIQKSLEARAKLDEFNSAREKYLYDAPKSYQDVSTPQGAARYLAYQLGQSVPTMAAAIVLPAAGSYLLEAADSYNESVDEIAKTNNLSPEQVIAQGLDKPAKEIASTVGIVNAVLDIGGLGTVVSSVRKIFTKEVSKEIARRGLAHKVAAVLKDPLLVEPATEALQEFNTVVASKIAAKKSTSQAISEALEEYPRYIDAAIGGLTGVSGAKTGATIMSPRSVQEAKSTVTKSDDTVGIEKATDQITTPKWTPPDTDQVVTNTDQTQQSPDQAADQVQQSQPQQAPPQPADQSQSKQTEEVTTEPAKPTRKIQPHEEIARQYHEEERNPSHVTPQELVIADTIGKINPKSFSRFGDENTIGQSMAKSYFSKNGETIDQVAKRASETLNPEGSGNEITPDDVANFMKRFVNGPQTVFTPSGNPKLADLANQYSELTGKAINRRIAAGIAEKIRGIPSEAESLPSKFFDKNGTFDAKLAIAEYEANPEKFQKDYGFSDDDIQALQQDAYEQERGEGSNQEGVGGTGRHDQQGTSQDGGIKRKGGPLSAEFGNTSQDPAQVVSEITSKPLTHVPGLNMGSGIARGTYVSTEEAGNRYEGKAEPAKVSIKSPFVFKSENGIIPFRNQVLNDHWQEFTEDELEGDPFSDNKTIEQLSPAGIEKLAQIVRDQLIAEGYDSIYLPETDTQEGELIVFDRQNVQIGDQINEQKATDQTPVPTDEQPTNQARAPGDGDTTGPPKSPDDPFELHEPQGPFEQGARQTVEALQEESNLEQELKDGIEDFENYDKHKQTDIQAWAKKTVESMGETAAMAEAISWKWGRPVEQKIALLSELARRFSNRFSSSKKSGFDKVAQQAYDSYMAVMDELSKTVTDTAQALAYLGMVGQMFETKEGAVRFAKKQIEESRQASLKNYDALKQNAKALLDEIDKLTKEELMKSKKVQELVGAAKKARVVFTKEKKKEISDFFDSLKIDTKKGGGFTTSQIIPVGVLPHVWNAAVELIKDTVLTTADVANAIQAGIDYIKKNHNGEFDADKLASDLTPLVKKLMPKSQEEEQLEKKKQALVNKYLPKEKPAAAKKKKEFFDKVIDLSNAGAVSDQQLDDAIATIFGLPAMTPEIAAKIDELVQNINKAPQGRFRNTEITKLTDYIAQQQKFSPTAYMIASYKAGIFSGIDTQALNLQGNAFNVLELGFAMGFFNPKTAGRFYRAMGNMNNIARASTEALQVLKTGFDPRDTGGRRRILEQRERSFLGLGKPLKGWAKALDPTLEQQKKYVFRALSAGDILFSSAINDAIQNEFFARQAAKMGFKGKEAAEYIRQQMGYTPENIKAAGEKAAQEAADGKIPNDKNSIALRTYEIIEQQRDPDIVAKSKAYAAEQIMTNTPKGYIGELAKGINQILNKIPALNFVIPVVNFAANAMSRAVQYLPVTAGLRELIHGGTQVSKGQSIKSVVQERMAGLKNGDMDTELRLRRAAIGTVSMITLIALLNDDEDDKNLLSELLGKKVKIHGFGPGTQFNRQKNYQMQESGWKPYSIQVGDTFIPYRNYPALNVILATVGEYNDAVRYGKLSRKEAGERLSFALVNSFKVITEMGFLTSINTVTAALLEGDAKSVESVLTRTAQGELVPKFQRNIANLFDPKVYSGKDIATMTTRGLPVINSFTNEPLVNALGEPVEIHPMDRIALWNTDSYSKYSPIWKENNEKKYFFSVPSRLNLEQKFGRPLTDKEYNQYFQLRGQRIVADWSPELAKLSKADYHRRMELIVRFADYEALVKMGVMQSDIQKEINYQIRDILETKRDFNEIRKSVKP